MQVKDKLLNMRGGNSHKEHGPSGKVTCRSGSSNSSTPNNPRINWLKVSFGVVLMLITAFGCIGVGWCRWI